MATIYKYFHVGNQNLYSGDLNLQSPVLLTFSKIKNGVKGETKSHMHAHLEIFYFENGGGYLEFYSKLYPLKAHDLLVVDSKRLHCQYSDDEKVSLTYYDFAIDNLHLNGLAPNSLTLKGFMIHSFENKHNKIYENILRLLDEFNHKLYSYHSKIQAIFTEILVDIIRLSPVNNLTLSESDLRNANRTALIAAKYYIDEHYSEEINLEILTKQTFMNKSYLVTQFKKLFNISPMQYLNLVRMEQAKLLLSRTSESVTQIAVKVGFNNPVYFAEVFSKTIGVPPTIYRKTVTEDK